MCARVCQKLSRASHPPLYGVLPDRRQHHGDRVEFDLRPGPPVVHPEVGAQRGGEELRHHLLEHVERQLQQGAGVGGKEEREREMESAPNRYYPTKVCVTRGRRTLGGDTS